MPLPSASTTTTTIARIAPGESGFPAALRRASLAPAPLWHRGRLPSDEQPAIAMVGSRAATRAGCGLTSDMAAAVARQGYAVISGGALGIDAAAHRGALAGGGRTFAVMGCGLDVVYPDRHGPLFDDIVAADGGLLSEYPPGTPPRAGQFPIRNRVVVALAGAVVVVEAKRASGALITARLARELGRHLFAVPGTPGTDDLIASGAAAAVRDGADLLAQLAGEPAVAASVPEPLRALVAALGAGPAAPIEVARRLEITLPQVLGWLAEAELAGWARRLPGGRFEVPRAS